MKIKKGDKVKIIAGKDRGKVGTVERVYPKMGKILVSGVNTKAKYIKEKGESKQVRLPFPIDASNAMIVDKDGSATRVGYKMVKDKKVRYSKKSGNEI